MFVKRYGREVRINVGIVAYRRVGKTSCWGAVYVPRLRNCGRIFRGVESEGVIISLVRIVSSGERIKAVIADAATATPMAARGLGESRVAVESASKVGSGKEKIAESKEEVQDSSVEVSIQWMKEAFCPVRLLANFWNAKTG